MDQEKGFAATETDFPSERTLFLRGSVNSRLKLSYLRIHSFQETPYESTDDIVLKLARQSLQIKLSPNHLDRSHRTTPRPKASIQDPQGLNVQQGLDKLA